MNWQSQIIELLTASLIRPIVLAAAAWLILRLYKVRHPASRHAVWTVVLIGMIVLPIVSFVAPQWKLPVLPKKPEPVMHSHLQPSGDFTDTESSDVRLNTVASASQQAVKFVWPWPQTLIVWCYLAAVLNLTVAIGLALASFMALAVAEYLGQIKSAGFPLSWATSENQLA